MSLRSNVWAAATVLVVSAATLIGVQGPAVAAADPTLSLGNFELRPNAMGDELKRRVAELDKELPRAGVGKIIADANRVGRVGAPYVPCNSAAAGRTLGSVSESICFNAGDNSTGLWMPQGVTTVADAQDDQRWGERNQPILVSWYDSSNKDGVANGEDSLEKGVRITFIDPRTGRYRHVLLVYPTVNSYDNVSYMSVRTKQTGEGKSLHAGGIVWYGNFLYVADTGRGFRVFDMRHIYDLGAASNGTTKDRDKIGRRSGTYYGHGYRYVMPQVASWTSTTAKVAKCTEDSRGLRFSYAGLDRSGVDHMVAGEYCNGASPETRARGRVVAWPMAGAVDGAGEQITTKGYRWKADAAHKVPFSNIQGAARFNGRWYLSQSRGKDSNGALFQTARATASTETLQVATSQPAAVGPEDLSHWQRGSGGTTLGIMWTVAEHPNKRMVYATVPKEIAG
ncbi:hypothetical protein SAMN05421810_10828 [Amycolatopsis arida]|uniref:Secreted protein n=1 Tax=Amycolatopsis arida TaxID=587909 RepID=A0A1I5YWC7_9PSEU|nr:hypothetical protein [Amycolatopsis arida]TDX89941.1 hypothetical protein CLV69_10828 [Amycolatopsis arida]SFQ48581.1 hypothetical protein SAMN05421810_10828 [Amycolatopsis arida]